MRRAFSPWFSFGLCSWGVAPGWDEMGLWPISTAPTAQFIPARVEAPRHGGGDRSRATVGRRQPRTHHPLRAKNPSHPRPYLGPGGASYPLGCTSEPCGCAPVRLGGTGECLGGTGEGLGGSGERLGCTSERLGGAGEWLVPFVRAARRRRVRPRMCGSAARGLGGAAGMHVGTARGNGRVARGCAKMARGCG